MSKKFAEGWANEWLNSEEGKELKEETNKEFLNYAVFGECAFKVLDEHVMEDLVEEFEAIKRVYEKEFGTIKIYDLEITD